MILQSPSRIDARLAIVSHPVYVNRDGAAWVNRVEWLCLQIFACHFRQVVLIRPRVAAGPEHADWVKLPDYIQVRELRPPGDRRDRLAMQAGVVPKRLPGLLEDADVVYGRLPGFEAYFALRLGRKSNRVTISSLHGDWADSYRAEWSTGWKRLLAPLVARRTRNIFRWVGREVDLLFTVGEALQHTYAATRNDVCVFANFLNTEEDLLERDDACEDSPVKILFVGALSPRKGVGFLLQAVRLLRGRGRDVRLSLVGTGTHQARYLEQARQLGLGDVVSFDGYVEMGPRLWRYYETHDLLVLPTVGSEGCPKVVVEAMTKSCPVISTRAGSVPFMIDNGVNGLLIEGGKPGEIASAVEYLLDHPEHRREIVRAGLQYAAANMYRKQVERVGRALGKALTPRFGQYGDR